MDEMWWGLDVEQVQMSLEWWSLGRRREALVCVCVYFK